jgi:putative aldouronate transport system substrate-binding protein
MNSRQTSTRRQFLGRSAGAFALAAGGGLLAACGGSDDDTGQQSTGGEQTTSGSTAGSPTGSAGSAASATASASGGGSGGGVTPTYVEYTGVKPDLPGDQQGVMPAFFAYPKDPKQAITDVPGKGGEVTALVPALGPQLLNPGANGHWQAVDKRLGVTLKVSGANGTEFTQMVQTRIAGGDLPDIIQLAGLPDLPQLLESKFTDLTEYLGGDAIKDYPMLANTPTDAWKTVIINGKVWGLPEIQAPVPPNIIVRTDMFTEAGASTEWSNSDEMLAACKALTNGQKHTWAWGQDPTSIVPFVQMMLGAPNNWKADGGKVTSMYEAPETKQAIGFVADMWAKGYIHPDSIANPVEYPTWFKGKTIAITTGALASWKVRLSDIMNAGLPPITCNGIVLPKFDGGGVASYWMGSISRGLTALKKASPDRIKELLGILNWMATPFGTDEYLLKTYGVKGRNYTLQGSDPIPIKDKEELLYFYGYMANPPEVLYTPGATDVVKRQHEIQTQVMPTAIKNPVDGLVSATALKKGSLLAKIIKDGMTDILAGRKKLDTWDDVVKKWKSQGGDDMAKEYAEALGNS